MKNNLFINTSAEFLQDKKGMPKFNGFYETLKSAESRKLFTKAKNIDDPKLRQDFINSIKLGNLGKYVEKIIHNSTDKDEYIARISPEYISNTKMNLVCYPKMFDNSRFLFEDVLGIIFHHEGFHAKDLFEANNIVLYFGLAERLNYEDVATFAHSVIELRAYSNQVKNLDQMNFSAHYRLKACVLRKVYALKYNNSKKNLNQLHMEKILELSSEYKRQVKENERPYSA